MQTQSNIRLPSWITARLGSMLWTQSYRMFIISCDLQDIYSELTSLLPCFLIQGLRIHGQKNRMGSLKIQDSLSCWDDRKANCHFFLYAPAIALKTGLGKVPSLCVVINTSEYINQCWLTVGSEKNLAILDFPTLISNKFFFFKNEPRKTLFHFFQGFYRPKTL